MNTKLVDSLVQIISSLTPEENALLQKKLQATVIQTTPGICGGQPRIQNTRIPVWTLVYFHKQGADETKLLRNYPSLTLTDLSVVWTYYDAHRAEIDQEIASYNHDDQNI